MCRTPRPVLLAAATIVLAACAPRFPPPPAGTFAVSPIDTIALRTHTAFLADDALEGRGTGTRGAEMAALYIESACRGLGLGPVAGAYRQPVPLEWAELDTTATRLEIVADGAVAETVTAGEGFVFVGGSRFAVRDFTGPARWVGGGSDIVARPARIPPLAGAVALTAGPVRRPAGVVLHERGAVAMLHLLDDDEAFAQYRASRRTWLMAVADSTIPSSFFAPLPSAIVAPRATRVLANALRRTHDVRVAMHVAVTRRPVRSDNVTCTLPGTDDALGDTAIMFTAHYDHLGISDPDANGDSIYNGFSDNAVGVAMLLTIAKAARERSGGFRHTLVFVFFTGEERGLLGSDYFVARTPVPLGRIRAVINLDAGAPPARPWNWRIAGGDGTALGTVAMDVAASRGWSAVTSPATPNSDYYPFAREGIPAVFIIPGPGPYEGLTSAESDALRRQWDHYHQPADEWHDDFPFVGVQRYAEYAYLLAAAVDRDPGRLTVRRTAR